MLLISHKSQWRGCMKVIRGYDWKKQNEHQLNEYDDRGRSNFSTTYVIIVVELKNDLLINIKVIEMIYDRQRTKSHKLKCENCESDRYINKYSEYLLYLTTHSYSERIHAITQPYLQQRHKDELRSQSSLFTHEKCQNGSIHLFRNDKLVLMVNQALALLKELHGEHHRLPNLMKEILLQEYQYDYESLSALIDDYPAICQQCRMQGYDEPPPYPQWHHQPPKQMAEDIEIEEQIEPSETQLQNFIEQYNLGEQICCLLESGVWIGKPINGQEVRTYTDNGVNEAIIIVTKEMRDMYMMYGESISIDVFDGLTGMRSANGHHFQIAFITGINQHLQPIIFGMGLINTSLALNYYEMLILFLQLVDWRVFHSVVSCDSFVIKSAIAKLQQKYSIQHLIGWHYVIQRLRKQLEEEEKPLIRLFSLAIMEQNQQKYSLKMNSINSQIANTNIYHQFLKNQHFYCLSKISPTFNGYMLSTARTHQLHSLLSDNLIYQYRFYQLLKQVLQLERKLRESSQGEQHLQMIRRKAEELDKIQKISQTIYTIEDDDRYELRYMVERDHWVCSCRRIYWIGLPCSHLIKIVERFQGCMDYYVNERWV